MKTITLQSGKTVKVGPGIIRLAKNFGHDMAQIAQAAVRRESILATGADRTAHLAICRANTCGYYSASQGRCLHSDCGCFSAAKTLFAPLKCPMKLW